MAQLSIAWCLRNSNVSTVITGATTAHQVIENLESPAVVSRFDAETIERIDSILAGRPQIESD
jgi:aryl-alcohol dehydrogenase-like predicted oxidoreductase